MTFFGHKSHCVKSVKIRSYSGPYFPAFSPNVGKYGPEITPYLDTFHAVSIGILFNKENTKIEQSGSEREITLQR